MVVFLFIFSSLTSTHACMFRWILASSCLVFLSRYVCEQLAHCCIVVVLGWESNLLFLIACFTPWHCTSKLLLVSEFCFSLLFFGTLNCTLLLWCLMSGTLNSSLYSAVEFAILMFFSVSSCIICFRTVFMLSEQIHGLFWEMFWHVPAVYEFDALEHWHLTKGCVRRPMCCTGRRQDIPA